MNPANEVLARTLINGFEHDCGEVRETRGGSLAPHRESDLFAGFEGAVSVTSTSTDPAVRFDAMMADTQGKVRLQKLATSLGTTPDDPAFKKRMTTRLGFRDYITRNMMADTEACDATGGDETGKPKRLGIEAAELALREELAGNADDFVSSAGNLAGKGKPAAGEPWTSPAVGMAFVWVPALKLWVGKYEVTNGEYRKQTPNHDSRVYIYKWMSLNGDRQPVVYASFDDAVVYAAWLTEQDKATLGGLRYRVIS